MSASSKKKLRKEQLATQLTEKQQKERTEARKAKINTTIFIVVMIAVALTAASIVGIRAINNSGIIEKNTIAAVTGDHELSSVTLNYYYQDKVHDTFTQWQNSYGAMFSSFLQMMGIDPTVSIAEQIYDEEIGATWADFFMTEAGAKARSDYALYDKAMAEGFELSEDDRFVMEYNLDQIDYYVDYYGYSNANAFLRAYYGPGSTLKTYKEYNEINTIATAYYYAKQDSIVYDDADFREYEKDKYLNFTGFDFASYHIDISSYLEGGTKDEDGNVTYSEAEQDAAAKKAEKVANLLGESKSIEELDKAISNLDINAENPSAATTKSIGLLYTNIPTALQEWLSDKSRVENDIAVIANNITTTDADGKESTTLYGYYVVVYQGRNDNLYPMANVRHLLVSFEGGTTDLNGQTVYSDAEKAAAKAEAESLLKTWQDGDATEESFSALVVEHSDDTTAAIGGLLEDVHQDSGYVETFQEWSLDPVRKAGDAGIIESPFGYHVMYYVGDDELTYRDYLIDTEMRTKAMEEWYSPIISAAVFSLKDTSKLYLDFVVSSSY